MFVKVHSSLPNILLNHLLTYGRATNKDHTYQFLPRWAKQAYAM